MDLKFTNIVSNKFCKCRMCGESGNNQVAEIHPCRSDLSILELYYCHHCGSFNFGGENPVTGYEDETFSQEYWKHYVEIGAGFEDMLSPLFMLGERFHGNILDIGCGFGFVVDFINYSGIGSAIGLETAEYGEVGKRLLNTEIYPSLCSDCTAIVGKKFDIVYACEVLEHVSNPNNFIKEISESLSSEGILVLTTPSASGINPSRNHPDLRASLMPYFHYFISSKEALELLMKKSGFRYVRVLDTGTRLISWASSSPLPELDTHPFEALIQTYLEKLTQSSDCHLATGATQRLFKYAVKLGNYEKANNYLLHLEKISGLKLGSKDILTGKKVSLRVDQKLNYNGVTRPVWMGSVLLYSAFMNMHMDSKKGSAVELFDIACNALEYEAESGNEHFTLESHQLLPVARREQRLAYASFILDSLENGKKCDIEEVRALLCIIPILTKTVLKAVKNLTNQTFLTYLYKRVCADMIWWRKNWMNRFLFRHLDKKAQKCN